MSVVEDIGERKRLTESESVAVAVEGEVEGGTTQSAVVRVSDEGPGLPPDEQERIWERFHRAAGIEVQTDAGATFWFTLPPNCPH